MESAIGVGTIGIMYKATLPDGLFMAVKRLIDSELFIRRFEFEIMIPGRHSHRNIVPLIEFHAELRFLFEDQFMCISTEMAFQIKRGGILFVCSLLGVMMVGDGVASDIMCLRSIKDSLEDPNHYLSPSWNFSNNTEGFICSFNGVTCWHLDNRVLSLRLSNYGLRGEFPRGVGNCSSLTSIDLSLNELTGPIPSDISTLLPFATSIDLSGNKFNGTIPAALGNCTYLNSLRLDNNTLSGQIPQELGKLQRIKSISFGNNHLSGPVPLFLPGSVQNYANNDELCGGPLQSCSSFHESFKDGLTVGYAFSVTSVIIVYMSYCTPWQQSKHKKKNLWNRAKEFGRYICCIGGRKTRTEIHHMNELQEKAIKEVSVVIEKMKSTMRLDELRDATECFSIDNAIGMGKTGIMYEGRLPNGWYLAVKRLFDSKPYKQQFLLEIRILGKYRHKNIVPLLGFCVERKERILVYQYMSNGRLSKWLRPLESEVVKLKWPEMIKIALGVARGLSWLHHSCNLHVVHNNLSSECILLDKNFEPKISNFGQAKFINPNIEDDASMPFYVSDGKKDVYGFGSLLFEIITGKTFKELSFSSNASNMFDNPSKFYDVIDKSLFREGFENEVYTLIKVACKCVQRFPDERPTMLEVYNEMSNVWGQQHGFGDYSDTHSEPVESVPASS
ncbi:hypothetical protein RJT34_04274 [Clitoria ternatea]|uniref:Protein kinase domain-containing protein n=1 Tax=Clitoria ternatea TaxID=43366 RepID=A0AAN9KNS0_CLITE